MKALVYGAGVIGCFLTHVLCGAGHQVTLVARGKWKETLEQNGLVIKHRLKRKTTVDHPAVTDSATPSGNFDVVFVVMQHQQLWAVLDNVAEIDTPLVVLVGNNLSAEEMQQRILKKTKTPKTVLFGFQVTAGRRENGAVHSVSLGGGTMSIGGVHSEADEESKEVITRLFDDTKYKLSWGPDMDGWYKTHLTLIMPVVYVCYAVGCDLRKTNRTQRRLVMDAAGEACGLLIKLGVPILPKGDELYYKPGFKRRMMSVILFIMAKTVIGELVASGHARHAVTEMQDLDEAFMALRKDAPDFPMPAFDTLRGACPSWETLHEIYDGKLSPCEKEGEKL